MLVTNKECCRPIGDSQEYRLNCNQDHNFFFLVAKRDLHQKHLKDSQTSTHEAYKQSPKKARRPKKKTFSIPNKQPLYKIYQRQCVILYIHPTPIHKSIHENRFNSLVGSLDIIESSSIIAFSPAQNVLHFPSNNQRL